VERALIDLAPPAQTVEAWPYDRLHLRPPEVSLRFVPVALLALAACTAGGHPVHDGTAATSDGGAIRLSYALAAPLARIGNDFTITVRDLRGGADVALADATVSLEFAIDGKIEVESTTPGEAGAYRTTAPVSFGGAGEATMTVHVTNGASELHDHATFRLNVP
jgi:hypothetical protein